ncbi:UNKNOWN [Stylonychia lemnae]|uniref:Cyclic nucleotide-binding domain-containing protein n=1 Tax=Stylonychia lemnae TaxID=5949 RepID=A0A077ZYT3_STYLE|nr:UNKNOWN [Stylonychia lemnae]|eukprot:CDW74307.1 UNKNOWN [Stylonychia lemnae]
MKITPIDHALQLLMVPQLNSKLNHQTLYDPQEYTNRTSRTKESVHKTFQLFVYPEDDSSDADDGEVHKQPSMHSVLYNKLKLGNVLKIQKARDVLKIRGRTNTEDLILRNQAKKQKHRYMIRHDSKLKQLWDAFIIACAILNSVLIPFSLAFEPSFTKGSIYKAVVLTIDGIFFVDIIVQFRSSTVNILTGEEISDPNKVAIQYLTSFRFWLDLLSSIPFDKLGNSKLLVIFGMLKIVRLSRIGKLIDSINIISQTKTNKTWIPPSETLTLGAKYWDSDDILMKYCTVLYYGVLMYLINETAPTVLYERQFVQIVAVFSVIVNTNIFGTITVLVGELNKKQVQFQEQHDAASTAMSNLQLPLDIQLEVKRHMVINELTKDEPEELQNFLNNISESLKQKVQILVMTRVMKDNHIIINISSSNLMIVLEQIVSNMELILTSPEEELIRENETVDCKLTIINHYLENPNMYFIAIGGCTVYQVPHFEFMKEDDKNSLQFNFELVTYQAGDHLQRPGDIPDSMMIIQKGVVDLYTKFNSKHNFSIMYLRQGAVLNHTLFLFKQPAMIPIKCLTKVQALVLTFEKVQQLRNKNPNSSLSTELKTLEEKMSKTGFNKLFLDYIIGPNYESDEWAKVDKRSEHTRQLKNASIYLLADFREKNKKPQVNEILAQMIQEKKNQIKQQKQRLGELMKQQKNKNKDQDQEQEAKIDYIDSQQVKGILHFVHELEKTVDFQGLCIQRLQHQLNTRVLNPNQQSNLRRKIQTNQRASINRDQTDAVYLNQQKDFVRDEELNWLIGEQNKQRKNEELKQMKDLKNNQSLKKNGMIEDEELRELERQLAYVETGTDFKQAKGLKSNHQKNQSQTLKMNSPLKQPKSPTSSKNLLDASMISAKQILIKQKLYRQQEEYAKDSFCGLDDLEKDIKEMGLDISEDNKLETSNQLINSKYKTNQTNSKSPLKQAESDWDNKTQDQKDNEKFITKNYQINENLWQTGEENIQF